MELDASERDIGGIGAHVAPHIGYIHVRHLQSRSPIVDGHREVLTTIPISSEPFKVSQVPEHATMAKLSHLHNLRCWRAVVAFDPAQGFLAEEGSFALRERNRGAAAGWPGLLHLRRIHINRWHVWFSAKAEPSSLPSAPCTKGRFLTKCICRFPAVGHARVIHDPRAAITTWSAPEVHGGSPVGWRLATARLGRPPPCWLALGSSPARARQQVELPPAAHGHRLASFRQESRLANFGVRGFLPLAGPPGFGAGSSRVSRVGCWELIIAILFRNF